MNNRLIIGLFIATCSIFLLLVGFLSGSLWTGASKQGESSKSSQNQKNAEGESRNKDPVSEGSVIERKDTKNPPPAPKSVANPDRVRQNLQPGKTYITHSKGSLNVKATDKDWGLEQVVTVNYAFEAQIDREIESNDGTTIVELRHFQDVRSVKIDTKLEDVRIDLGPIGDLLFPQVNGKSFGNIVNGLRWVGISPEKIIRLNDLSKSFGVVDQLSGKKVRLTYVDGKGVMKVEAVKGEITPGERDFHLASSLLSDSRIIPEVDIKIGNTWSVDGSNFANLVDPSLLARTSGDVMLKRVDDHIVKNKTCRRLEVIKGRILFEESGSTTNQIGYFEPNEGYLAFSPIDQIIIEAKLKGTAKLEKFSTNHLLFETRMRRLPAMEILYSCRVTDTVKVK